MTAEERIFSIVRGGLYAKLPSLALPLGRLTCREGDVDPAGTDGEAAVFAPGLLRREFLAESDLPERLTLHLLLHLMLGHPWGRQGRARALWDTACDLAVGLVRHALLPQEPETPAAFSARCKLQARRAVRAPAIYALLLEQPDARGSRAFAALLRECSEMRENRHVSGDEFQYAWYLYGLEHYGGMPLIEPLEYSEERRLRELAVVIDTSASCSRSLCAAFLGELAGILSREDLFFERFNLHILECDCEVQQDTRLTTLAELTDWLRTMTLHGGGGTDFRPAFRYVDGLVERGEFAHLPGLLYFTDGYGVFPDVPPAYRAVFVMLRYRYDDIDLPAWAEKLILEAEAPKGDERWI